MSGNFAIKGGGGGVGPLMANAILNFHFDYLTTSLRFPQMFDISAPIKSKGMYHGGSEHGDGALKPPKNFI